MKIINHPTGAFHLFGTPDGTPGMNRKSRMQAVNNDLINQATPAFPVPKKEYKGEIKERVVKPLSATFKTWATAMERYWLPNEVSLNF
jgi:hypothetical protein